MRLTTAKDDNLFYQQLQKINLVRWFKTERLPFPSLSKSPDYNDDYTAIVLIEATCNPARKGKTSRPGNDPDTH